MKCFVCLRDEEVCCCDRLIEQIKIAIESTKQMDNYGTCNSTQPIREERRYQHSL